MALLALFIDRPLNFGPRGVTCTSVLAAPLGPRTVCDELARRTHAFREQGLLVLPTFRPDPGYEPGLQAATEAMVEVVTSEQLADRLFKCEAEDQLLVIDPARWPADGYESALAKCSAQDYRGATHAIAIGPSGVRVQERVECDGNGWIRRILRDYVEQEWLATVDRAVFLTLLPARAAGQAPASTPAELRAQSSKTRVLSRDVPFFTRLLDLTNERDLLEANERAVAQSAQEPTPPGFSRRGVDVLVGRECRIHPSARLIGPLVIQEGVTIGETASIIGPAVVGARSRIQQRAMVAHSVLAANTLVTAGLAVRSRAVSGRWHRKSADAGQWSRANAGLREHGHETGWADTVAEKPQAPVSKSRRIQLAVKRLVDVLTSLTGLILLSPLLFATAALIKLIAPGPVFFVHRREGRGGAEFPCLKFRTMRSDAHRLQRALYKQSLVDGPQFKLRSDPRVTRLGRWLRGTNIDELPQLFNVLVGHMSLVGPRPSPFRENQICVPWRRARLSVRPGITGLWQICRSEDRSAGGFHEWIFYDLLYARHVSLWLDLKIMLATVVTLGGRWSVPLSMALPSEARTTTLAGGSVAA